MIEYIKEYGISSLDYEFIINNVDKNILDILILNEDKIKDILDYYNSIGIKSEIASIIVYRPDLIVIEKDVLDKLVHKNGIKLFVKTVKSNVNDLVLLGV